MAIELKGTIELKDITAVEFRCEECGHASIRKLDDKFRAPTSCGNCASLWQVIDTPERKALFQFLSNITSYAAKGRSFSLLVHVEGRFHAEGMWEFIAARPKPLHPAPNERAAEPGA